MPEMVIMPKLGFDMAEGTLVRWLVQEGQPVQKGAVIAEIETDKATVEVESQFEGVVARLLAAPGDVLPVNTPIAIIAAPGEKLEESAAAIPEAAARSAAPAPTAPQEAPPSTVATPSAESTAEGRLPGGVKASPLARRLAAEMRLDLSKIAGSGPGGRIVKRDLQAYLEAPQRAAAAAAAPAPPAVPLAPPAGDQEVPLSRLRAAIGRRMVEAKQQAPHFYVTREYDVGPLLDLRRQINDLLPEEGKLSLNDFIVKAVALTLRQFPNLNASYQGDKVVRFGEINIGVAVAVPEGLLTVVCRQADRKPLRQIAEEVRAMAGRARQGKVRPEDIEGSTFSTSNLGMFDVEHFIAIINPPEAAILAVGAARQVPVVVDGEVRPGWRMKATLSVDHRVSDGAEAAQFLQALARYLEQPLLLLVEA